MKKFLALVLCVVMVFSVSVTASASSVPYYSSGETLVTNTVYSSCIVTIPSILEMGATDGWNIHISECNVMVGESIKIYVTNLNDNNAITLTNRYSELGIDVAFKTQNGTAVTKDSPILALVNVDDIAEDKTVDISFSGELRSDTSGMTAGVYEGTMQYEIAINPY